MVTIWLHEYRMVRSVIQCGGNLVTHLTRVTVTLFYGVIVLQIGLPDIKATLIYAKTQLRVPRSAAKSWRCRCLLLNRSS